MREVPSGAGGMKSFADGSFVRMPTVTGVRISEPSAPASNERADTSANRGGNAEGAL